MKERNCYSRVRILPVWVVLAILVGGLHNVAGHGRMLDPPSRSSMWRLGFQTPKNYDDNGLNCGGRSVQHNSINKGRCGECGDEWSLPRPRANDEGGLYGTGTIGQTYKTGSYVRVSVELTSSHLGYFEFRLCPKRSAEELVTQECLDNYLLRLSDGSTRYQVPDYTATWYDMLVKLPDGLTCDHCVIQWYYTTGNSPGLCGDGTNSVDCNQESFVNCADVAIKA
ncbi:uncharacterized protein LOC123471061 [Daphnia magna]|uniref:Uncharacterized protein n=2 Tax=Daphnia magna TaxID=35525 RepID=A0ABQ9YMS2_9CRUS|nr:uncharacterized protein LOC123471061 [Daphnia magna]KAK4001909.1 hypothetical protein OUZ56_003775 [Daphnia magna]KZS18349.1 Uncharacterized protein APZ42_014850 [Daphnia magna]